MRVIGWNDQEESGIRECLSSISSMSLLLIYAGAYTVVRVRHMPFLGTLMQYLLMEGQQSHFCNIQGKSRREIFFPWWTVDAFVNHKKLLSMG